MNGCTATITNRTHQGKMRCGGIPIETMPIETMPIETMPIETMIDGKQN